MICSPCVQTQPGNLHGFLLFTECLVRDLRWIDCFAMKVDVIFLHLTALSKSFQKTMLELTDIDRFELSIKDIQLCIFNEHVSV